MLLLMQESTCHATLSDAGFDGFSFFFIAGFFEESEHVALVGFHAGLVEGVDAEDVAADAAGFSKK